MSVPVLLDCCLIRHRTLSKLRVEEMQHGCDFQLTLDGMFVVWVFEAYIL